MSDLDLVEALEAQCLRRIDREPQVTCRLKVDADDYRGDCIVCCAARELQTAIRERDAARAEVERLREYVQHLNAELARLTGAQP